MIENTISHDDDDTLAATPNLFLVMQPSAAIQSVAALTLYQHCTLVVFFAVDDTFVPRIH